MHPVIKKFGVQIVEQGFTPFLPTIVKMFCTIWRKEQYLPFTVLSRLPDGVDYYEPNYDTKRLYRILGVLSALRSLAHIHHATEFLYVSECWMKDTVDSRQRTGESLSFHWRDRHEHLVWSYEIRNGPVSRYLRPLDQAVTQVSDISPLMNPWHSIDDLKVYVRDEDWADCRQLMQEFDAECRSRA